MHIIIIFSPQMNSYRLKIPIIILKIVQRREQYVTGAESNLGCLNVNSGLTTC